MNLSEYNLDMIYVCRLNNIHNKFLIQLDNSFRKDILFHLHLFEVKSVNMASVSSINRADYEKKVNALRNCYIYASKLTGYHFWKPIKKDNDWTIYHAYEGKEETVSYIKFERILKTGAQHA